MKQFCFWNEDDLENLPADFKLVPFNVAFIEQSQQAIVNETPKVLTSKKSPLSQPPSALVKPVSNNQAAND